MRAPPTTLAPPSGLMRVGPPRGKQQQQQPRAKPRSKARFAPVGHQDSASVRALQVHMPKVTAAVEAELAAAVGGAGAPAAELADDAAELADDDTSTRTQHQQQLMEQAVVVCQSVRRAKTAQRTFRATLLQQQRNRCRVSAPILVATVFEQLGALACDGLTVWSPTLLPEWFHAVGWLLLLLPGVCVVLCRDLRQPVGKLNFSITHAVFYCASLYTVAYRAKAFSFYITGAYAKNLPPNSAYAAPLLGQLTHQTCFTLIASFARLTLGLAGMENCFAHHLFPFHFFDVASNYAFFSIQYMRSNLGDTLSDGSWLLSVAMLQVNIILRNSGTYDGSSIALLRKLRLLPKLGMGASDAIFQIQFFARLAIQLDLADVTAMVVVPAMVSLLCWRDGVFSLAGTSVVVRPCDLLNIWSHFGVLFVVKPMSFWIARRILERKMRLTLLGKRTLHGRSHIAGEAHRKANATPDTSHDKNWLMRALSRRRAHHVKDTAAASPEGRHNTARRQLSTQLTFASKLARSAFAKRMRTARDRLGQRRISDRFVLNQAFDSLGFSEERKAVIGRDFAVAHLQYAHLFAKIVRRSSGYYLVVVLFQLFAVLPAHEDIQVGRVLLGRDDYGGGGASAGGAAAAAAAADTGELAGMLVPVRAAWLYLALNASAFDGANATCEIGAGWPSYFSG